MIYAYMEKLLDRPGNLFFTAFTALFCQKLGETHYFVRRQSEEEIVIVADIKVTESKEETRERD